MNSISHQIKIEIINLFLEGKSFEFIREKTGLSRQEIRQLIKSHNVKRADRNILCALNKFKESKKEEYLDEHLCKDYPRYKGDLLEYKIAWCRYVAGIIIKDQYNL